MRVTARVLPAVVVALVLAIGCSSAPPEKRGSTLSQAADEAEKDQKTDKKKVLTTTPKEEQEPSTVATVGAVGSAVMLTDSSSAPPAAVAEPADAKSDRYAISLLGGGGSVNASQFDGFGALGVGGSIVNKRMRGDLWFFYLPTSLTEQSGLVDALTDEREFAVDFRFRYSFTPHHTFAGIYGLLGGRWGMLQWKYENGVVVEDDSGNPQTIDDDRLTYYAGYLGVGIAPVQTNHFLLGVDFSVGLKSYESYTHEGFNQDVFDDFIGFGQLLFSADYRF